MLGTRPQFQTQSLIDAVRTTFQKFTSEDTTNSPYSLANCFMSAFAMFNLKYPSLLQFDQDNLDPKSCLAHNLKSLYKVDKAPCDTTMRQRLDGVSLEPCHKIIDVLIDKLQRAKVLEDFVFINGCKLFSLDGTEFFHHLIFIVSNAALRNSMPERQMKKLSIRIKCWLVRLLTQAKSKCFL